jgi:hypothetical protein
VPEDETSAAGGQESGGQGLPVRWILMVIALVLLLTPAGVRLVRRRRRLRAGDGEAAYREVVDTMVDLRLGSQSSTPRTTLAVVGSLAAVGEGSAEASGSGTAETAIARILRAVEWQRYGSPATTGAAVGPDLTSVAGPGGAQVGGVLLAERQGASPSDTRPGALAGDIRTVRRALARRAGWVRRVVAVMAPPSVISGLVARGAGRSGSGAS